MQIEEVMRTLGYKNNHADEQTMQEVGEMMQVVEDTLVPRWDFQSFKVQEWSNNRVALADLPFSLEGEAIAEHLKSAWRVYLMAVTLGVESERLLLRTQAVSMADSMIIDSCMSVYVEEAADRCEEEIRNLISKDEELTFRFSPGYGDFPLGVHKEMIRSLRWDRSLGITVTDSMMMVPSKSIIAVIGVENMKEKQTKTMKPCGNESCEACALQDSCNWKK